MADLKLTHDWSADHWDWPMQHHDGVVKVLNSPTEFSVGFEVHYFTPKEVQIKVDGHDLVVHCEHETRDDTHGKVTRQLHRTYKLPHDVDTSSIKSHMNQKGVLVITANKKK